MLHYYYIVIYARARIVNHLDSVFFICKRTSEISKCDVSETNGVPNIEHDNLFALNWSRFGNVTLEKWSKSKEDWILQ